MRLLSISICFLFLAACSQLKTYTSPTKSILVTSPSESVSEHQNQEQLKPIASENEKTSLDIDNTVSETGSEPETANTKEAETFLFQAMPINDTVITLASNLKIDNTPLKQAGVIEVLDFPFDPVENNLSNYTSSKNDFSNYGFFTPDNELENLINQELLSLRIDDDTSKKLDLLVRIRKNFQLDLSLDNKRIDSQLSWYIRNPNYLTRTFNRASRYLHHIVNEVKRRDLPMELALLPFVESAYNPFAYSHGRAAGLWQFIPGTGKIYGLEQDWWHDGRRDVLASTEAALDYLTYLNNLFNGNWLHALAAYNSGSGRVRSAIRKNLAKNKDTDFWSLNLPRETRAYVPKLIALSQVVLNPEKYKIDFPYIADSAYFEKVDIGAQIDLAQAATLAEIDISEVYQLNPGFNQWASSPLGPHHLLIPIENASVFRENLKTFPPEKRINWQRYSVTSGDSLIRIAKKFNTTPMLIKEINNLKSNMIKVRQKLLIPTASKGSNYYDLSQTNRLTKKQALIQSSKSTDKITYRVNAGDTMWDLSREHKVGLRELARWNGIAPTDPIKPGQQLVIWSKSNSIQPQKPTIKSIYKKREMIQKVGYYVRKGDSLARIAGKFNVSINDLVTWNKLDRKKYLKPGQKITVFVDITDS
jgi:membrane-bound lytic murein transglycosylase D